MRVEHTFGSSLAEVLGTAGYGVTATGHRTWVVSCNRRPAGARILGVVGMLVAGVGFPFLGLRRSRCATVLLHEGSGGSWLELEGALATELGRMLVSAKTELVEPGEAASDGTGSVDAVGSVASPVAAPSSEPAPTDPGIPSASPGGWTPPPAQYDDHTTMVGTKVGELRKVVSGVLRVVFDTGEVVLVDREVWVGRAPTAGPDVTVVPINDPDKSVSMVHFLLRPSADVTWIKDNGSTNGTGIIRRSGSLDELVAGAPTPLEAGDVIVFGRRRARVDDG